MCEEEPTFINREALEHWLATYLGHQGGESAITNGLEIVAEMPNEELDQYVLGLKNDDL